MRKFLLTQQHVFRSSVAAFLSHIPLNLMSDNRIGLWLIGARGGVGVSTILGLSALQSELIDETGLVTALPEFAGLRLPTWNQFVVGGHEIRDCSLAEEAWRLHRESRVFSAEVLTACQQDLDAIDDRIRPGTLWKVGDTIRSLASDSISEVAGTPREIVQQLQDDLRAFREENELTEVVVVNLASTEAPVEHLAIHVAEDVVSHPTHHLQVAGGEHGSQDTLQ